jgi:hypothetical protein
MSYEYDTLTTGMGQVIYDDSPNQTNYMPENESVGGPRRRRPIQQEQDEDDSMGQDTSSTQSAPPPPPAPVVAANPAPAAAPAGPRWGVIAASAVGAGALTALGVWGLMKWRGCPAERDATSLAEVGGVGALAAAIGALGAHHFLGSKQS